MASAINDTGLTVGCQALGRPQRGRVAVRPHVGAVAAMLAQLEGVAVRGGPVLEDKDELVARAIEGAHAAVVLDPNDQVLEFREDNLARGEDLGQVTPVHADVVDRPLDTVRGQGREGLLQKPGERLTAHLPQRPWRTRGA